MDAQGTHSEENFRNALTHANFIRLLHFTSNMPSREGKDKILFLA
jgi:hypothetical protein